jgi:hypothetical protein
MRVEADDVARLAQIRAAIEAHLEAARAAL